MRSGDFGVISCEFLSLRLHLSLRFGRGSSTVDDQSGQYRVPATQVVAVAPTLRPPAIPSRSRSLGPDITAETPESSTSADRRPDSGPPCCDNSAAKQFDLIVVNSVWDPRYALLPVVLKSIRVLHGQYCYSPRGVGPGLWPSNSGRSDWRGQRSVLPIDMACRCSGRPALLRPPTSQRGSAGSQWSPTEQPPDAISWACRQHPATTCAPFFLSRINPRRASCTCSWA